MKKHMTIHMNNAKPGAPDLFVAVAELDAENPDQANEKTIAAGKSSFAVIPEDNAIGFLIPVSANEDPWEKLQLFIERLTTHYLNTLKMESPAEEVARQKSGLNRWLPGLLPFKGFVKTNRDGQNEE